MGAYEVSLEHFEGPLDLLLHLIQKNKIDIYEIPIAEITNQYLAHIEKWKALDMAVASEFIVMAARLLEMKSRMLLPRSSESEESEEEMREQLVKQLMDYQVFKNISLYLEKQEHYEIGAVYKEPEYIPEISEATEIVLDPKVLETTFLKVFSAYSEEIIDEDDDQEIVREIFTVEEKIALISERLRTLSTRALGFSELFEGKVQRSEVIVTLMALLEMVKTNQISLYQKSVFQEIFIKKKVEG